MKKVIKGRLYNTGTAKCLGEWWNRVSGFGYVREWLYLTKSGAYFLHGEGGANSRYAQAAGNNSWEGGEQILPMTPDAAREWAEKNLEADEYAEIFGEPEEASSDRVPLNITINASLKSKLMRMREETGKSISQLVEEKFQE